MRDSNRTIREENLCCLAQFLGEDAPEIQRISRSIHKIGEQQCNGFQTWDGREDTVASDRADKREAHLLDSAGKIAARHNVEVYYQSDPRGWPLYLYNKAKLAGRDISAYYNSIGIPVCSF